MYIFEIKMPQNYKYFNNHIKSFNIHINPFHSYEKLQLQLNTTKKVDINKFYLEFLL